MKKGLNINLSGEADKIYASIKSNNKSLRYVVKPTDFHLLKPKLFVKVGDKVKAGSVLFFDKSDDRNKICSPVSGEVIDIVERCKKKDFEVVVNS